MKTRHVIALLILGFALTWTGGLIYVISHAANTMIGFHPLVLFAIPIWATIGIASLVVAFTRYRIVGISGLAGTGLLALILWGMHFIWLWSYDYHIWQTQETNLPALQHMKTLPASEPIAFFRGLYEPTNLFAVSGFTWYEFNTITAPSGIFYGLNVSGIPHVRVEKVHYGWLGLALSDANPSNVVNVGTQWAKYRKTRHPQIWIWDTGS